MISADVAISRFRRDLTLSTVVKFSLIGVSLICLFFVPGVDPAFVITGFLVVWLMLSAKSATGSRWVADSPTLISLGRFDEAEVLLARSLETFSIFRTVKLLSIHHLAVLRHKQRQWEEAAKLCRELLSQRLGGLKNLSKPAQLMLADSLLQMGDLAGTYDVIRRLYDHRLTLAEALQLLPLQLDYETRVGAWSSAMNGIHAKLDLCELLSSRESARAQALLALAARRSGREDWARWLADRVRLLTDVNELVSRQPIVEELFA